jgi:hypothetical protein
MTMITRENDHSTSIAAAKKAKESGLPTLRQHVYDVLKTAPNGLTDCEIRAACSQRYGARSESTYRKRRTELTDLGLVTWTGERRANEGGNLEKVWVVVEAEPS